MSRETGRLLLVVAGLLLAVNLAVVALRPAPGQTVGTIARLPSHGNCIGLIAHEGILYRAFADGTVEAFRLGSGQGDWRPVQAVAGPPVKR